MQEISTSLQKMPHTENGSSLVCWRLPHSSSDQSSLSFKKSNGFSCSKDRGDSCQSTSNSLEKMKNWLWMKHQHQFSLHSLGCLNVNWVDRSLQHWKSLITDPFRKWLKCRRKQKLYMHSKHVQAALSVTSVSAALAIVTAATAVSTIDKQDSRTGIAVASAAALVAAHCAEFAKHMGADQQSVLASVSAGQSVKHPTDVLELTTSAAASLRAARNALKGSEGTCFETSMTQSNRQMSPFSASSLSSSGSHAECQFYSEMLARGAYFFVRVMADKVHQRFVSVCLNDNKQVILKLTSRCLAGAVYKVAGACRCNFSDIARITILVREKFAM